jgi:NAD(P)-dependent dehydrogenase (short-subunit alcohol dehydrogenase family)
MSKRTSKTILITGASSGFGRDTAALARAGHNVFASMRDVNGKRRDQANELREQGIAVVELDVSNDDSVDAAVREVLARAGRSSKVATTGAHSLMLLDLGGR